MDENTGLGRVETTRLFDKGAGAYAMLQHAWVEKARTGNHAETHKDKMNRT